MSSEEDNFSDKENEEDISTDEDDHAPVANVITGQLKQMKSIPYVDYSETINNTHIAQKQLIYLQNHFKTTTEPPPSPCTLSFFWENICMGAYNNMFLKMCKNNLNMETAYNKEKHKKNSSPDSIVAKLKIRVNKLKTYYTDLEKIWKTNSNKKDYFVFTPPSINDDYELHIFWHHIINGNYSDEYIYKILENDIVYKIYLEHIKKFKKYIYMTKYEFARIRGLRLEQLARGAIPYIQLKQHSSLSCWETSTSKKIYTIEDIFEEEMRQKAVPIIVRRATPTSKTYYFYVKDMNFSEYIK